MANTGVDVREVVAAIKRLRERSPEIVDKIGGQVMEHLVSEMKQEGVVPRDTGRLRDSHGWDRIKSGWRIFANTSYAAAVHERHKSQGGWFRDVLAKQALPAMTKAVERMKKELGM